MIAQVGTISANGDSTIGNIIAEAMKKVGKDGVITVEESKTMVTELQTVDGMQFDRGYLCPYFITDPDRMEVVLEDPYILIHEKKISNMKDLLPVLEQIARSRQAAACDRGRGRRRGAGHARRQQAARHAERLRREGSRASAIVARPCSRTSRILTGGKAIMEETGIKLEGVRLDDLGRAKRVDGGQGQHHHRRRRRPAEGH